MAGIGTNLETLNFEGKAKEKQLRNSFLYSIAESFIYFVILLSAIDQIERFLQGNNFRTSCFLPEQVTTPPRLEHPPVAEAKVTLVGRVSVMIRF